MIRTKSELARNIHFDWFTKVRKTLSFFVPNGLKNDQPWPAEGSGRAGGFKTLFLHKILSNNDTLYPLVVF
jgi:hypothetical protein